MNPLDMWAMMAGQPNRQEWGKYLPVQPGHLIVGLLELPKTKYILIKRNRQSKAEMILFAWGKNGFFNWKWLWFVVTFGTWTISGTLVTGSKFSYLHQSPCSPSDQPEVYSIKINKQTVFKKIHYHHTVVTSQYNYSVFSKVTFSKLIQNFAHHHIRVWDSRVIMLSNFALK